MAKFIGKGILQDILKEKFENEKALKQSVFVDSGGKSYIVQIWDFESNKRGTNYGEVLEKLSTAGVLEKETDVLDMSIANFIRIRQLSNGKNAKMTIAYRGDGPCDIYTQYLGSEGKRLLTNVNDARVLAYEMIIPELERIVSIVNKGKDAAKREYND